MKLFMRLCYILLVGVLYRTLLPVYADSFWPQGEVYDCQFVFTLGMYADAASIGVKTISSVASISVGNLNRYSGVDTTVHVKPKDRVSLGWFWSNYSGHSITIKNMWIFFETHDFLDVPVHYREVYYLEQGVYKNVNGPSLLLGYQGIFAYDWLSSRSYGRKLVDLQIREGVVFNYKKTECGSNNEHLSIARVWGALENKSLFSEHVLVGSEEVEIAAGGMLPYYSEIIAGQTLAIPVVTTRVNCLKFPHASIVSRNDVGNYSWGGAQYDIALQPGSQFCIVRDQYSINVDLPACNQKMPIVIDDIAPTVVLAGEDREVLLSVYGVEQGTSPVITVDPEKKRCLSVTFGIWKDSEHVVLHLQAPTIIDAQCGSSVVFSVSFADVSRSFGVTVEYTALSISAVMEDSAICVPMNSTVAIPVRLTIGGQEQRHEVIIPFVLSEGFKLDAVTLNGNEIEYKVDLGNLILSTLWAPGEYSVMLNVTTEGYTRGHVFVDSGVKKVETCSDNVVQHVLSTPGFPPGEELQAELGDDGGRVAFMQDVNTQGVQQSLFSWKVVPSYPYQETVSAVTLPYTGRGLWLDYIYAIVTVSIFAMLSIVKKSNGIALPSKSREM